MNLFNITVSLFFILFQNHLQLVEGDKSYNGHCRRVRKVKNTSLEKFTEHTWYSHMQQEVKYQNKSSFYCVTATYNIEKNRTVPFFNGNVISVYNYANYDGVNGVPMNTKDGMILCAKQPNKKDNSTLAVSPCTVPGPFGGPYWIIGLGENYEWLVVSGGQPNNKYKDGCTTNTNTTNNSGLWIFSKYQNMPYRDLIYAKCLLKEKGYTLSQLQKVEQHGCKYDQAFIKTDKSYDDIFITTA